MMLKPFANSEPSTEKYISVDDVRRVQVLPCEDEFILYDKIYASCGCIVGKVYITTSGERRNTS